MGDVIIGVGFAVFWMTSSAEPTSRFRGSKFYWKLGSKDSYSSLASNKTLSHEIGSLGQPPGDDDVIQNCKI